MQLFNCFFKSFTSFECWNFRSSDFDFFTSLWVATFTSCTFTNIPGPGVRTAYFAAFVHRQR